MAATVRVYVDGKPLDVASPGTAVDAVAAVDVAAASSVRAGSQVIVDNRGLPVASDSAVYAGAIFRVVSARQARPQADGAA